MNLRVSSFSTGESPFADLAVVVGGDGGGAVVWVDGGGFEIDVVVVVVVIWGGGLGEGGVLRYVYVSISVFWGEGGRW